jgi:hypothetical protein
MQRLELTTFSELADSLNVPEQGNLPENANVLPDSFADWLARPSGVIASESVPEQGVFVELINECPPRNVGASAARARRR